MVNAKWFFMAIMAFYIYEQRAEKIVMNKETSLCGWLYLDTFLECCMNQMSLWMAGYVYMDCEGVIIGVLWDSGPGSG